MNKLSVIIKDDNGRDCSIENIRIFQKHLIMFHRTGTSIHEENGHYFTVNDSFREMVDGLVGDLRPWARAAIEHSAGHHGVQQSTVSAR